MAALNSEALPLGELLRPVRRLRTLEPSSEYRTLGVRWYGNGPFAKPPLPGGKIAAKSLNEVKTNDVVYSKLFAWKGSFGYITPNLNGVLASTEFPTYLVDETRLLPEFFALWASRPQVWDAADLASTGTTANSRNRLAAEDFLDLEIELPSLREQCRILDAIAKVERSENAHRQLATATFQLLGATREVLLGTDGGWEEAPDGWQLVELSAVADIRSGITKGRKVAGSLFETPFIRAANVQNGFLDLSELKTLPVSDVERERFRLREGDVLMTEGGNAEHVGRGWVWEGHADPAVCQNHVFRVRVDTELVSPRFLAYAIGASPARAYCLDSAKKTTNLASINKSQVSAMRLPLPPLGDQQHVTQRLDLLRGKAVRELRLAQGLTSFRRALVDDLVTGVRNIPDG